MLLGNINYLIFIEDCLTILWLTFCLTSLSEIAAGAYSFQAYNDVALQFKCLPIVHLRKKQANQNTNDNPNFKQFSYNFQNEINR